MTRESPKHFLIAHRRLLQACRTSNQVLKLHTTLESLATPQQWRVIGQEIVGRIPTWLVWIATRNPPRALLLRILPHGQLSTRLNLMTRRTFDFLRKDKAPSEYSVAFRKDGMALFRNPNNADSSLIVLWNPDIVRRPGMPLWMFLEQTWALNSDILVLRSRKGTRYSEGVKGLGSTIEACCNGITELAVRHDYKTIYSIGVSLGSVPALYCSQNEMIQRTLLAGPVDPERIDPGFWSSIAPCTNSEHESGAVLALVGTNSTTDMETAKSIGTKIPLTISLLENANHNVLWRLAARSELTQWLRDNLING